jgi:hypothetical protein
MTKGDDREKAEAISKVRLKGKERREASGAAINLLLFSRSASGHAGDVSVGIQSADQSRIFTPEDQNPHPEIFPKFSTRTPKIL